MTTLEILKQARALLAKGWCQGYGIKMGEDGVIAKRDIVNALNDAAGGAGMIVVGSPEERAAFRLMWDATGGHGLIKFNDDPRTTLSQVLYVFDACIYLEERHSEPAAVKS